MKLPICISFETIVKSCNGEHAGNDSQISRTGHDAFRFLIKALENRNVRICIADSSSVEIQHIRIWVAKVLMKNFGFSEQKARDVVLWELGFTKWSDAIGFPFIDDRTLDSSGSWEQIANDLLL